jgi:hypothetical protein
VHLAGYMYLNTISFISSTVKLQCRARCAVRTYNSSHTVSLGALYGPIILHMRPASVHCTFVNKFHFNMNLKLLGSEQDLELKTQGLRQFNISLLFVYQMNVFLHLNQFTVLVLFTSCSCKNTAHFLHPHGVAECCLQVSGRTLRKDGICRGHMK